MSKVKFFVFASSDNDSRVDRLREECERRGDVELIVVSMKRMIVTDSEIYDEHGTKLDFSNSIVWLLTNLTTTYCVSASLNTRNILTWPDKDSVLFADKFDSSLFFARIGIPHPKTVFINSYYDIEALAEKVGGFPCVIKKTVGSTGKFVEIVKSKRQTKKFIVKTFKRAKKVKMTYNRIKFLLQKYVEEAGGADYRVLCLDGEILGAIKREAVTGFKANVSLGGTATQVPVDDKMKEYSLRIMKEGNLFYAGIDFVKRGDDYMVLEVNTSAQFKGFEAATGVNVPEKIIQKLLEKRLNK